MSIQFISISIEYTILIKVKLVIYFNEIDAYSNVDLTKVDLYIFHIRHVEIISRKSMDIRKFRKM